MEGDPETSQLAAHAVVFQSTPSAWRETQRSGRAAGITAFQSTPSAWRETCDLRPVYVFQAISIHSLRMEGDSSQHKACVMIDYFNPLPPHGGRPCSSIQLIASSSFQSTPSAWRETHGTSFFLCTDISFQSTPSAWRETFVGYFNGTTITFQSTPSAWRETATESR